MAEVPSCAGHEMITLARAEGRPPSAGGVVDQASHACNELPEPVSSRRRPTSPDVLSQRADRLDSDFDPRVSEQRRDDRGFRGVADFGEACDGSGSRRVATAGEQAAIDLGGGDAFGGLGPRRSLRRGTAYVSRSAIRSGGSCSSRRGRRPCRTPPGSGS
jgi:hypothetical protein